ncbi:acyl-CoA dehydrogenase, middle domain containing protein [Acanthamoeba castellanii str. Neff]|uniref:Acyl-CoA dehydrogenase, middle domain containing protein n=1 Tax=Acanthamoeba castellanii (strain ATCC 30010 / Neff) TaxID=1257118 RepID=L8GGR9_ACACF|nr:acyl-CoA dehydrogenase, middle domain containing protein [Acanthamoeba castellanii str. Neff]ELR12034.1 acyl-CoA dehydrogenase, middle domain containing protein [Acanthamoeba castellanii str. Neff]
MNEEMRTIARERENAPFDVRELTHVIYGGPQATALKERMALIIERDPVLFVKNYYDMTRPEARQKCMAQVRRALQIAQQLKPEEQRAFSQAIASYDRTLSMRLYVHCTLFKESIYTHGTKEQWLKWKDDIESARVLGCFAMTELGHSSFLRGIETTATYDKATGEFILHSPTLTASKWWIGMAGETATHTVAIARLIVDNKDLGLNWFVVQLRSLVDGTLMPGVTCGDIGAKMGRAGYITHVAQQLQADVVAGKDVEEAWNDNLMALVSCSRVHTWYFVVNFFHQVVEEQRQQRTNADGQAGIAPTLHKLCLLFALDRVHAEAALFLEYGYITGEEAALVRRSHLKLCREVRKDAVLLTDALAIPDYVLKAPFGAYDGDIYRNSVLTNHIPHTMYNLKVVTSAPQTNVNGRPFYYEESVAPLIRGVDLAGRSPAKL